jgi:diketogulonate reductase-like aldo/keto reductase
MALSLASQIELNNGVRIPVLGLGVFQAASGEETRRAVRWALDAGYRHLDTAKIYGNEADVGAALRESGVPREEVFVTTKLWNADHGYDRTLRACGESLARLGLAHVDLYLVHWPVQGLRLDTWRAMETLLGEGKCRAIGVSNYQVRHLEELLARSRVTPAVNQVELSPFLYPPDLVRFCHDRGIALEAYSPLTRGVRLRHPAIVAVAAKVGRTPAQVLIRWALEHGFVVLPKSVTRARIEENARVFDFTLDADAMRTLDGLDEGLHTGWDPTDAP